MIGLRHVLVPPPRWLRPRRVALAAVAAAAVTATPPLALGIPDSAREIAGSAPAVLVVVAVTTALGVALAWRALRARSTLNARLWMSLGGAVAGALALMIAYAGVMLVHGRSPIASASTITDIVLSGLFAGTPLGFFFGTAYALVVLPAIRAEAEPSHDGLDRVVFAAGVVLLAAVAAGARISGAWTMATPWPWLASSAALGALLTLGAAARMIVRVRLLARVQKGDLVGFHVVPCSGREDEAPLLPLVRTAAPFGVLAATGASAPYRGARGVLKLALAPLPGDTPRRPLAGLLWAALAPLGHAAITLFVGAGAVIAFFSPILAVAWSLRGWN